MTGSKFNIWWKVGTFGGKWEHLVESGNSWWKVGTVGGKWVQFIINI
jgi:hypothetical protein